MNSAGIAYVIVGIIALAGALFFTAFVYSLSALTAQIPPELSSPDVTSAVGTFGMISYTWLVFVYLSSILLIKEGIRKLRKK